MKSVSAAIVILAGAIPFAAAGFVQHQDTYLTLGGVGLVLMVAGATQWVAEIIRPTDQKP